MEGAAPLVESGINEDLDEKEYEPLTRIRAYVICSAYGTLVRNTQQTMVGGRFSLDHVQRTEG